MPTYSVESLIEWDLKHCWHPFTPHSTWMDPSQPPLLIARGEGCWLIDVHGQRYFDGNSSIWTNLHGHAHPRLVAAIREQLERLEHSSFLGLSHDQAPPLAARLSRLASQTLPPERSLQRVFFSDDGSTAIEAALKMAHQFNQQNGKARRTRWLSLQGGYHGDTVGAMSWSQSGVFHRPFRSLLFPTKPVMAPSCYGCPFNRIQHSSNLRGNPTAEGDARLTRQCRMECVDVLAQAIREAGDSFAGLIIEPRVQGAAGFLMHPEGYLERASELVHQAGGVLVLDEVMTGFHRTGPLFAFQKEKVTPDLVALAKGLTGGTMPLAATLCTEEIFQGFGGSLERTFYHGHSYTAHPLGCAAAQANLDLLESPGFVESLEVKIRHLTGAAQIFRDHPCVADLRQEGLILAIALLEDVREQRPFHWERRVGHAICHRARAHGLITRPVGDTLLLMPPLAASCEEMDHAVKALHRALHEELP